MKINILENISSVGVFQNNILIGGTGYLLKYTNNYLGYIEYLGIEENFHIKHDMEGQELLCCNKKVVVPKNYTNEDIGYKYIFLEGGGKNEKHLLEKNYESSSYSLFDMKTGDLLSYRHEVSATGRAIDNVSIADEYLLSVSSSKKYFARLDYDLKILWRYDLLRSKKAKLGKNIKCFDGNALFCIKGEGSVFDPVGGSVVALEVDSGELVWQTQFPALNSMQEFELHGDSIYCAASNMIYQLCARTGEIRQSVDTGAISITKCGTKEVNKKTRARVVGDYLFFLNNSPTADSGFQSKNEFKIYDLKSFKLIRDVTLPQEYSFSDYSLKIEEFNGKAYIELVSAFVASSGGGVLEIDLNDVHAELEVEKGPKFIESEVFESDGKTSYRLSLVHETLDDILRFGEIEIKELALKKGKNRWNSEAFNAEFNGKIHLQIDGKALKPHEHTEEWLPRLCERINSWAEGDYYDGQAENPVTLTYEII